jgi:hypothetical protein
VTEGSPVTLRLAADRDRRALRRLAERDSAEPLAGTVLVAEVAGELLAARSMQGGRAIADPFRPTAELVALLRVRADQLADRAGSRRLGLPLRPRRRRHPAVKPSPRPGRAVAYATAAGPPRRNAGI